MNTFISNLHAWIVDRVSIIEGTHGCKPNRRCKAIHSLLTLYSSSLTAGVGGFLQDKSCQFDPEDNIESMRAKLRELERRCELQALKHEEVLLELEAVGRKQKYRPSSSAGSMDLEDILANGYKGEDISWDPLTTAPQIFLVTCVKS